MTEQLHEFKGLASEAGVPMTLEETSTRVGIKGSDPSTLHSLDKQRSTIRELVRMMHSMLEYLNREINTVAIGEIDEAPRVADEEALDREMIRGHLKAVALELGPDPRLALSMAKAESGYDPHSIYSLPISDPLANQLLI